MRGLTADEAELLCWQLTPPTPSDPLFTDEQEALAELLVERGLLVDVPLPYCADPEEEGVMWAAVTDLGRLALRIHDFIQLSLTVDA